MQIWKKFISSANYILSFLKNSYASMSVTDNLVKMRIGQTSLSKCSII